MKLKMANGKLMLDLSCCECRTRDFLSLRSSLPAVLSDIKPMFEDEDFCFNRSFLATALLQSIDWSRDGWFN